MSNVEEKLQLRLKHQNASENWRVSRGCVRLHRSAVAARARARQSITVDEVRSSRKRNESDSSLPASIGIAVRTTALLAGSKPNGAVERKERAPCLLGWLGIFPHGRPSRVGRPAVAGEDRVMVSGMPIPSSAYSRSFHPRSFRSSDVSQ